MFKTKRRITIFAVDLSIFFLLYCIGVLLIYIVEGRLSDATTYIGFFAITVLFLFLSRVLFGIYSNLWRYANSVVYLYTIVADAVGGLVAVLITCLMFDDAFSIGVWKAVLFIAVSNIATLASRFVYRMGYKRAHSSEHEKIPVAIVGAGQIGTMLAEELNYNDNSKYSPVCFIDKDKDKFGSRIFGLNVYSEEKALDSIEKHGVSEVFIAIPDMNPAEMLALSEKYSAAGYSVKLYDFPIKDGDQTGAKRIIREIKIEDLLFRNTIQVVDDTTKEYFSGKTVLVTGGGGSIGSELCRQIADCTPKKLIIFDIYENNAYDIQQELIRKHGKELDLIVEIGSVRDRDRLEAVFMAYRPEIVIHAAAHKHVPLMEHSNAEAIKNNAFGTYNTADMAEKYGAAKFILISTDKAVNPTNVMGASKRLCEMIVQSRNDSKTAFCAVRFGNVLGSNGTVIPLFKRQIDAGGPITITDKRIIRYFMTIPEATGLVMQAGAMAKRGELFVLDMGKPVRIIELAENMIRLSGLEPYKDIDIVEIGLRPGEKLYEELLIKTESLEKTKNNLIFIELDTPLTRAQVDEKLDMLRTAISDTKFSIADGTVTAILKKVVPTFRDSSEVNENAESSKEMAVLRT